MLLFTVLFLFIDFTKCARILGIFPAPGYSQFILAEKLMTELAIKGHDVTVISSYKPKITPENYTTILVEGLSKVDKDGDLFQSEGENFMTTIMSTQNFGLKLTEYVLQFDKVQQLLRSNLTFELIILEQFFDEALMGFGKHFEAPLILFSSIGPSEWNNNQMGNPNLPSFMPVTKNSFTTKMTFLQRIENSMAFFFDIIYKYFIAFPRHDNLLKKYFPKKMDLENIRYDSSLMLLNSHYSINDPVPLVNAMIEIGGFHITHKKLPNDLKKFLDEAPNGVIYFSMGTNLKPSNLNKNALQAITNVFSKLKLKVVWKFEKKITTDLPNVLISNWLPQQDILAHPNVKLFITHGGLLSMTEAVHFAVPMIGIPIFGDQKMNVAKAERYGFAIGIPYTKLTEETLSEAIKEILENPKYLENVRNRSRLYHDRPIKPLDLAIYWIEHVINNKGATHLKFAGLELTWFQLYLLDILCILILIGVLLIYLFKKINKKRITKKVKVH